MLILYCTVLYCTVLYCTTLYYTVLYCTVLYCTVLYSPAVLLAVGDVDHAGDVLAQELVTDLPQHLQLALVSTH